MAKKKKQDDSLSEQVSLPTENDSIPTEPKKKKEKKVSRKSKKAAKKKAEKEAAKATEEQEKKNIGVEKPEAPRESEPLEEKAEKVETALPVEKPKKKKQKNKKSSAKKDDIGSASQNVEDLLAVEIDAEKTLTLNEAFADIENQLKELEKGTEGGTKNSGKRSKKKLKEKPISSEELSAEEKSAKAALTEDLPLPLSKKLLEETLEDAVAEFSEENSEEAQSKGFIKEFTIQLNKKSVKEETLDDDFEKEADSKSNDKPKLDIPKKISDDKAEELTLFDAPAVKTKKDGQEEISKSLPSFGKLQDIKGEEIEEFIEPIEISKQEPEEVETADSHIKPLPKFLAHFVPVQGDGVGEIIRKGFIVICIVLLLVSMGVLIDSTRDGGKKSDESAKDTLNGYADNFAINKTDSGVPEGVLEKYHALYKVNNDMVGWLTLPGTPIDMPVVQYTDNEYYETTDFNGNDLIGLVAYADSGSSMQSLSRRTVLYVAAGEDFGAISGLDAYKGFESAGSKKESFALSFGTLYDDYEWEIIAGVLTNDVQSAVSELSIDDFSEFSKYLLNETIYPRSLVNIKSGEKVLMLCVPYSDAGAGNTDSNNHLILIAKLLNRQSDD